MMMKIIANGEKKDHKLKLKFKAFIVISNEGFFLFYKFSIGIIANYQNKDNNVIIC